MREVKLIWKFTPASLEENNVENNEPKSYFSGDPEAPNFVEHQPLDNVKIEQTPGLVLQLTLKVLKPGELFIHGIEYKLKALFPQSESTDYTIKGKQALKVVLQFHGIFVYKIKKILKLRKFFTLKYITICNVLQFQGIFWYVAEKKFNFVMLLKLEFI